MSDFDEMNLGPRWYVVHTYSGYENKVKISIEKIVENRGLGHLIYDVQIPVEKMIVTNEKGDQKEVETKLFPCYVLLKMTMTDESWHVVRNIRGVTGFVGPGSRPVPLTEAEVAALGVDVRVREAAYSVGDSVIVVAGFLAGSVATVKEINNETGRIKVAALIGGKETAVEMNANEVEPLNS